MAKPIVFLTGATGVMGSQALERMACHTDCYHTNVSQSVSTFTSRWADM